MTEVITTRKMIKEAFAKALHNMVVTGRQEKQKEHTGECKQEKEEEEEEEEEEEGGGGGGGGGEEEEEEGGGGGGGGGGTTTIKNKPKWLHLFERDAQPTPFLCFVWFHLLLFTLCSWLFRATYALMTVMWVAPCPCHHKQKQKAKKKAKDELTL